MWATCNIGANSPSDYGDYFAWGEAETKSSYTKENSATYGKTSYTFLDAATAQWGSAWRMPTEAECQELVDNCTWTWTTVGGHKGYRVMSKKNGNSIFLPAAGLHIDSGFIYAGGWGAYWTLERSYFDDVRVLDLHFDSLETYFGWYFRFNGLSIRPVLRIFQREL